jgi:hypothetical protein
LRISFFLLDSFGASFSVIGEIDEPNGLACEEVFGGFGL